MIPNRMNPYRDYIQNLTHLYASSSSASPLRHHPDKKKKNTNQTPRNHKRRRSKSRLGRVTIRGLREFETMSCIEPHEASEAWTPASRADSHCLPSTDTSLYYTTRNSSSYSISLHCNQPREALGYFFVVDETLFHHLKQMNIEQNTSSNPF